MMSSRVSPFLPACVASPDPLPNAAEHAPDCSLHRRISSINGEICRAQTAGIRPMVASNQTMARDAVAGGLVDVQGDPIDEGCCGLCCGGGGGGCNLRSGHEAGGEGQGRRRDRQSACASGIVSPGRADVAHRRREGDRPRTQLQAIQRVAPTLTAWIM